jgi:hypothetical protein
MELYIVKLVIVAALCFVLSVDAQQQKQESQDTVWICTRWAWGGNDMFNRTVVCLNRRKEDCSKRLHKEICRGNK